MTPTPGAAVDPRTAYFDIHLGPAAAVLERDRQAAVAKSRSRRPTQFVISAISIALCLLMLRYIRGDWSIFGFFLAFIGVVGAWSWMRQPLRDFQRVLKGSLFDKAVGYLGEQYSFASSPPWSTGRLKDFGIVPSHNRVSLFDYIKGTHRDVPLQMCQAVLERESTDSKGRKSRHTVFRGLIVLIEPPKHPEGVVQIRRDGGWLGNAVGGWFTQTFSALERVHLEDPHFEDRFAVYASDQIEARTILTPSFMARLLDLEQGLDKGRVTASFNGAELLILIPSHTLFQPSNPKSPLDLKGDFLRFVEEMAVLHRVIDTLKLDQDIGL